MRVGDVLADAVASIGGAPRQGQQRMASEVWDSLESGEHLLVQAGTGTGKSLGYLVPTLGWAVENQEAVVVATATLTLQHQLANKDIPIAASAVARETGREPRIAILKGRSNYACLLKVNDVVADQETLPGASVSELGAEVVALREWAEQQRHDGGTGERDDAIPHSGRAWAQVSAGVRECVGAAHCPFGTECFAELARSRARQADLIVTNHALLAIDAMTDASALPEHAAVVIDEAHELTDRVTSAASAELSDALVRRVVNQAAPWLSDERLHDFDETIAMVASTLSDTSPGRVKDGAIVEVMAELRGLARDAVSAIGSGDPDRQQAAGAMRELFETSARIAALDDADVVWVSESDRFGKQLNVAPLSVSGLLRNRVLDEVTTILTSATLSIGGSFTVAAGSVGLRSSEEGWRGLDVGSPFDYPRQGILYVATELPRPTQDLMPPATLNEIVALVEAAGGRTLGLFTSKRAATYAAEQVAARLPGIDVLVQGSQQLPTLQRRFVEEPETCLFGTLSLWQGIDVPGDSCRLVIIDRLPFPRPDDPLMQARKEAADARGGNGFMQVAASHAALLLAQGAGRLIRSDSDRGVVAVLDPRLHAARYGGFLRTSLPPMWSCFDVSTAMTALRRLGA